MKRNILIVNLALCLSLLFSCDMFIWKEKKTEEPQETATVYEKGTYENPFTGACGEHDFFYEKWLTKDEIEDRGLLFNTMFYDIYDGRGNDAHYISNKTGYWETDENGERKYVYFSWDPSWLRNGEIAIGDWNIDDDVWIQKLSWCYDDSGITRDCQELMDKCEGEGAYEGYTAEKKKLEEERNEEVYLVRWKCNSKKIQLTEEDVELVDGVEPGDWYWYIDENYFRYNPDDPNDNSINNDELYDTTPELYTAIRLKKWKEWIPGKWKENKDEDEYGSFRDIIFYKDGTAKLNYGSVLANWNVTKRTVTLHYFDNGETEKDSVNYFIDNIDSIYCIDRGILYRNIN